MEQEKEKQVQEKYMELQVVAAGLKELQSNIQAIDEQIVDVMGVVQALNDLKNVKVGTETFMTLNPGIFVKAELKDNKEVLINVGAGVAVKKSIHESTQMLDSRMNEIKKQRQRFLAELENLGAKAQELEQELNKLVGNV